MNSFNDGPVIVEDCLLTSGKSAGAEAVVAADVRASSRASEEAYANPSGDCRIKINLYDTAEMLFDCGARLRIGTAGEAERNGIDSPCPSQGITGSSFHDVIHSQTAGKTRLLENPLC